MSNVFMLHKIGRVEEVSVPRATGKFYLSRDESRLVTLTPVTYTHECE